MLRATQRHQSSLVREGGREGGREHGGGLSAEQVGVGGPIEEARADRRPKRLQLQPGVLRALLRARAMSVPARR